MFKRKIPILFLCSLLFFVTGCQSGSTTKLQTTNNVTKVLESQTNQTTTETELPSEEPISLNTESLDSVDIDLTTMSSDMVFVTVYQLMVNPEDYVGQTIKIHGSYYASLYEPTEQYAHYVIIEDATACCAQGLEFIWDQKDAVYPDDYPAENTQVTVIGQFETYYENDLLYCRLNNASLTIES